MQAQTIIKINAGGNKVNSMITDKYFIGGGTHISSITTQQDEYKDVRHGTFQYQIPVPNGRYQIKLHFAEVFTNFPSRIFDVIANDQKAISRLNIFAEAGNNALTKTFDVEAVDLEGINLKFVPISRSAIVSAIEIIKPKPEEWCPGPVLSRISDKTFRIGANWTNENPCHIQFAIQPANRPDPITVIRYTQPIDVTFDEGVNDNFYVYVPMPAAITTVNANSVSTTYPAPKIFIAINNNTNGVSCSSNCIVSKNFSVIKMFPPNTFPLGTVLVQNSIIAPKINNIAGGERQITIGPNAAMTATERDGVWLFEVNANNVNNPVAQRNAQQVANDLKVAELKHQEWMLNQRIPPIAELASLREQVQNLHNQWQEVKRTEPISERTLAQATAEFRDMQMQLNSQRQRLMYDTQMESRNIHESIDWRVKQALQMNLNNVNRVMTFVPAPSPEQHCIDNLWSQDEKYRYVCGPDSRWVRYALDTKWGSRPSTLVAQKEE